MDLNWKPYAELGGKNGHSSAVYIGACGKHTGIEVRSPEATAYLAMNPHLMCSAATVEYGNSTNSEESVDIASFLTQ